MSPEFKSRRWARGAVLAALVLVGRLTSAIPARSAASPMISDRLPGREAVASLEHLLSVPDPRTRWRGLPTFGRDLFRGGDPRSGPVEEGPVGPDYVLGPGDNLIVFVSGFTDTSFALTLNREGKVFLPRVGSTFLWGLSFADAETLVKGRLATVLRNARVQVSMGRVRALEVFVLGAVQHPGKVTLTGFATAFNALYAAGGPDSLGSLRDIRVLRAHREIGRLDLYRFLLAGDRSGDTRLQSGDVVFVGFARSQIGIQGAVARPGVYEADGPLSLKSLLAMAGGASPFADLARVHVERVDANGGFRLQDFPLDHGHGVDPDSLLLSDFDLVTVMSLNDRVRNAVTLDGFVRHPGEYELTPGLRLSQLIAPDRLLPEAWLDQAELRRVDSTFHVEVRPFSVRRAWSGDQDLALRPMDAVTIFSSARFPHSVTLEGEVTRPGSYTVTAGERLSDVLRRAGGITPEGFVRGAVLLRISAAERGQAFVRDFAERQRIELAQRQARLAASGDTSGAAAALAAERSLADALEHQGDPGRVVLNLDEKGRWVGTPRDPRLENGDRLVVPQRPATVAVLGSVMNPGTLLARRGGSFGDYIKLAGGMTRQADAGRSYVLKANGEAVPRRAVSRIDAGDAIVVPPREVSNGNLGRGLLGGSRLLMEMVTAAALVLAATRR